ncbi:MAG: hypothetical protein ACE5OZ_01300 [Candidatus Heimdallarchaeota archaeon]
MVFSELEILPVQGWVNPTLICRVEFNLPEKHHLIDISATVKISSDGSGHQYEVLGIAQLLPAKNKFFRWEDRHSLELFLPLTARSLEAIEDYRLKNDAKDVYFLFELYAASVSMDATNVPANILNAEEYGDIYWLEATGTPWLKHHDDKRVTKRISSSDWVNKFQQHLGIGRYHQIEIPIPETILESIKTKGQLIELAKRAAEASDVLKEAEREFREGNWKNTVLNTRNIFELFKKGSVESPDGSTKSLKALQRELFIESGLPIESADALSQIITQCFSLTNSTHHAVEKGGKQRDVVPSWNKEDAIFALGTSSLFVRMIVSKLKNIQN